MSDKKKSKAPAGKADNAEARPPEAEAVEAEVSAAEVPETEAPEAEVPETEAPEAEAADPLLAELEAMKEAASAQEEKYLRLCAEYDNYRKRTAKEKESVWASAKGETVKAFLPVYDNLERALKQETTDEAYRKGVELTMQQLKKVLGELGLEEISALGQVFDANVHSAVLHVEDPELGENTVKDVVQTGFKLGDSVIRYAMVVVAN